jgi:tRNA/rRNA methyltransferase
MDLQIVLVEPMYEGNIGSVARVMMNFGFKNLVLVNPCPIEDFGWAMASHAKDILEKAKIVSTLDEGTANANLIVGTTGKISGNNQKHLRLHLRVPCLSPKELAVKLEGREGLVALLLGREDKGLTGQELAKCDIVVSIPTSQIYPIMNISHAAAILFYELSHIMGGKKPLASRESLTLLQDKSKSLLIDCNYPTHKIGYTVLMFKRILGRAELTEREARTILGVIKSVHWKINKYRSDKK